MMDSMLQSSSEMDRFRVVTTQWSADQVENEMEFWAFTNNEK